MPEPNVKAPVRDEMPDDVKEYIKTCSEGRLYGQLMEQMNWTAGKDRFKDEVWFQFLYGSNKDETKLNAPERADLRRLNEVFVALYPTVYRWMWAKKEKNYKRLACDMQRAESRLMIDQVAGRLAEDHPHIPILTIHDSYLTTPEHVDTIREIILDEFAKLVVVPTLNLEDYSTKQRGSCDEARAA